MELDQEIKSAEMNPQPDTDADEAHFEEKSLINIKTSDGQIVAVSRSLLDGASPYLHHILEIHEKEIEKPSESPEPPISLPITKDTFETVLNYLMKDQIIIQNPKKNPPVSGFEIAVIVDILSAANLFQLIGLKKLCCDLLQKEMNHQNIFEIHMIALLYNAYELLISTRHYILYNFSQILQIQMLHMNSTTTTHEKYYGLEKLPFDQILSIIKDDKLNIVNENETFEALKIWVEANDLTIKSKRKNNEVQDSQVVGEKNKNFDHQLINDGRVKLLETLLKSIRFGNMTLDYFRTVVFKFMEENDISKIIMGLAKLTLEMQSTTNQIDFKDPLTRPRAPKEVLFAIGGWSQNGTSDIMETYDIRTNTWLKMNPQSPVSKAYHSLVVLDNIIFLIGGGDISGNQVEPSNSVFSYNPASYTWSERSPMTHRRCHVSSCALNGLVYAMGGMEDEKKDRLYSAEVYNPEEDFWRMICPMNIKRSDASTAILDEKIYIAGGFTGTEITKSVEYYNPKTNQWTMSVSMMSARCALGLVPYKDGLLALGGYDGKGRLNSVEFFNYTSSRVNILAKSYWLPFPFMINQRSNFGAATFEESGKIFVVGGYNGITTMNKSEYFDPEKNSWFESASLFEGSRSALGICILKCLPNIRDFCYLSKLPHQQLCPFQERK